jgi:DNA-binding MarR family transcriptional regulator
MSASHSLRLWRSYIEGSIRLQTALDEELRADAGISLLDYHLLLLLAEAPRGRLRMGELANEMAFSSSRLTYQVGAMERRGWVLRERAEEDRRGTYASITRLGRDTLRRAGAGHGRVVERLFLEEVSEEELEVVAAVFDRVSKRIGNSSDLK